MTNSTDVEEKKPDRPWLFQPGWKGGPGRPKRVLTAEEGLERQAKSDLRAAAKEFSGEALMTVVEIMRNPEVAPNHRLTAAEMLLSRGHGKARQHVDVKVDVYDRMSDAELIRLISGKDISDEEVERIRGPLMLEGEIADSE